MSEYYLISLLVFIFGLVLKLYPPNRNNTIGYKSPFAIKNEDTWKEANSFGSLMAILGSIISAIFSFTFMNFFTLDMNLKNQICSAIVVLIIFLFILYTEIHLRKLFDKDGNRR